MSGAFRPTADRRPRIVIVGGGFAGVAAATGAARLRHRLGADLDIVVVNPDEWLTIRPRLYEADPVDARVHLPEVLEPLGVELEVGLVTTIDVDARLVRLRRASGPAVLRFDRLVLAAGSHLSRALPEGDPRLHDVDTYDAAMRLRGHVLATTADITLPAVQRFGAVVVGAGLAGIETATELAGTLSRLATHHGHAGADRVVLVDPAPDVALLLGPRAARPLADALLSTGVRLVLGRRVEAVDERGAVLDDGTALPAGTIVWTGGLRASGLAAQVSADLDAAGRVRVDELLRVPGSDVVLAAGDAAMAPADDDHTTVMSCQHAIPTGELAGHNAAASILGAAPRALQVPEYVTCVDLGAAGGLFTRGWERSPQATGPAGKEIKRRIVDDIHPKRWATLVSAPAGPPPLDLDGPVRG